MTAIGLAVLPTSIGLSADGLSSFQGDPAARPPGAPEVIDRTVKVLPALDRFAVAFGGNDYLLDLDRFERDEEGRIVADRRGSGTDPELLPWWTRAGIVTNAERLRFWEQDTTDAPDDPEQLVEQLCELYGRQLLVNAAATMPDADEETLSSAWELRIYVAGWSPQRGRGEVWQGWMRAGRPEEQADAIGVSVGIRELASTDELRVGVFEDWTTAEDDTVYQGLDGLSVTAASRELVDRAIRAQEGRETVVAGGRVLTVEVGRDSAAYV